MNEKSIGSPIKVPEWKQEKLSKYFGKKSPKANKARQKVAETKDQDIQGAQSPLLGDKGGSQSHLSDYTGAQKPSEAPVGVPEECGRGSRMQEEKKRTKLVLEKWTQVHSKRTGGSTKKQKPKKSSSAEDNPTGSGFRDIRKMFEEMGVAQDKESKGKEKEPEPAGRSGTKGKLLKSDCVE